MKHELNLAPVHPDLPTLLTALATIPAHDPDRYETTDCFENPKCTNGARATFAVEALETFQKTCGMDEDLETAAADLICDLLHLLHANNHAPLPVLHNAINHFLCEAAKILPIRVNP